MNITASNGKVSATFEVDIDEDRINNIRIEASHDDKDGRDSVYLTLDAAVPPVEEYEEDVDVDEDEPGDDE